MATGRSESALDESRCPPVSADPLSWAGMYVLDRDEKVGDTRGLELASGKELWTFAYEALGSFMFAGLRTTPTVDGTRLHRRPLGDLYAISTKTRKPAWHKNIWKDFGAAPSCHDGRSYPLICGDLLIVAPQLLEAGVVAYDKLTGALKWKSAALSGIPGYGRRRSSRWPARSSS